MMSKQRFIALLFSHSLVAVCGFAIGIYTLPILIAPPAPKASEIQKVSAQAIYSAELVKDLAGSDALHWGQGKLAVANDFITLNGKLAPGPDYKLYLSPEFIQTESEFKRLKTSMVRVGDIKTFNNFVVAVPAGIDVANFTTVVIWCETFSEFISSASYR